MLIKALFGRTQDPNILYLVRTHLNDSVLVLKLEDGHILLVVSETDFSRATIHCGHASIMQHSDFEGKCRSMAEILLNIYQSYSGTMLAMPFTFPVGLFVKLKELSAAVPMQIMRDQIFLAERMCKTSIELQYIRDAVRAAGAAFTLVEDILKRSVIEIDPAAGCIPREADRMHVIGFPQGQDVGGSGLQFPSNHAQQQSLALSYGASGSMATTATTTDSISHHSASFNHSHETESLETHITISNAKYILRDPVTGEIVTSTYIRNLVRSELTNMGYFLESCIIACGKQACDPSCIGQGSIRPNELIVCDIYPRCIVSGYYGDMTRTYLKGRPNAEQHRMVETVISAHQTVIKEIGPGRAYCDLHNVVNNIFLTANYGTKKVGQHWQGFCHGLGHGVGIEVHELPFLDSDQKTGVCTVGNVFTVEPGLYYPHIGGCRIEDVIVVTENGAEILSDHSYDWIIP